MQDAPRFGGDGFWFDFEDWNEIILLLTGVDAIEIRRRRSYSFGKIAEC